jgi:plastocyanin
MFSKRTLALALPVMTMFALFAFSGCGSISSGSSQTNGPAATASSTASPTATEAIATNTTGPSENQVDVSNFQFSPATLTVAVGTTVTWKGVSGSHTVTSDAGAPMAFDQPISQGGTVTVTFTVAGTYHYHCSIHPSMHGAIVVSAPSSTPGAGK